MTEKASTEKPLTAAEVLENEDFDLGTLALAMVYDEFGATTAFGKEIIAEAQRQGLTDLVSPCMLESCRRFVAAEVEDEDEEE